MSIGERHAYGEAIALLKRHGMVVATEEHIQRLLAVVEAAKDFLISDGDYFSWTEDERHCLSRLKEALLALEE